MGIKFVRRLEVCRQGRSAPTASLREPVPHFRNKEPDRDSRSGWVTYSAASLSAASRSGARCSSIF
jgi:hypothetical protein